jgi:glyoxylase-like metal-dependent hydrolase (beta-lactamase superfamily II)
VTGDETVDLGGSALALNYYPAAHTDGDITVAFPQADVLHTGDIYWNGVYPFIDRSTGGTIDGKIAAVEAILAGTSDSTVIVPRHGNPVSNRAELHAYRDMLVAIRDNVSMLKRQGHPLEEVIAAKPTAAYDASWGSS